MRINAATITEFTKTALWQDLKEYFDGQIELRHVEMERLGLGNPEGAKLEQYVFLQGELQTLRLMQGLPELLNELLEKETEKDDGIDS